MRISKLAAHKARLLLVQASEPEAVSPPVGIDPRPEMLCFRGQTLGIIRHFFEISSQVGRLPSLLGREFFRARVSHHAVPSFEDQAVFVRDVEICLSRLSEEHAEIITLVGLYDFSHEEVAEMKRCSMTAVHRSFREGVDSLSEIFLHLGLLAEDRPDRRQHQAGIRKLPADIAVVGKKPSQSVRAIPMNKSETRASPFSLA